MLAIPGYTSSVHTIKKNAPADGNKRSCPRASAEQNTDRSLQRAPKNLVAMIALLGYAFSIDKNE